jgi:hypothetical protein
MILSISKALVCYALNRIKRQITHRSAEILIDMRFYFCIIQGISMEQEDHPTSHENENGVDWKRAVLSLPKAFGQYPVWATILILSEIAGGVTVYHDISNGVPMPPNEIEARMRIVTLFGLLGGGFAEGSFRALKWLSEELRNK